jgi:hypothetical protein
MHPDDSDKIWEAIDKLRSSQGKAIDDLRGSQKDMTVVLEAIKTVLGERCVAREAAHKFAFEAMNRLHSQHESRLSKLELDVSLLGLTKARLVGFGLGLAAMSSILTAILMKIVFGGGV